MQGCGKGMGFERHIWELGCENVKTPFLESEQSSYNGKHQYGEVWPRDAILITTKD